MTLETLPVLLAEAVTMGSLTLRRTIGAEIEMLPDGRPEGSTFPAIYCSKLKMEKDGGRRGG